MNGLCSHERLELALAGKLDAADESMLQLHLDDCELCAAEMERLAGGEQASREIASMLIPDNLDAALPLREECSTADFVVDHLEPSDDSAVLGRLPYAKVIEVVEALKAAGVTEFSFSEARVGDGKYRVANRTGIYEFDDKHGFSICRPSERPQWFTVSWPAAGDRPACALRTFPNVSDKTAGKWAVVWEPGTDVLWWVDDSQVGKMTLTDPARVIVDREGRTNNFSRDFGLPEEVKTEFRRLGFVIGRDKTPGLEATIGGNSGGQTIVSAEFGWWCIEGTVTDADGKPLANVPVRVSTNQEIKTEKTNKKKAATQSYSDSIDCGGRVRRMTKSPQQPA